MEFHTKTFILFSLIKMSHASATRLSSGVTTRVWTGEGLCYRVYPPSLLVVGAVEDGEAANPNVVGRGDQAHNVLILICGVEQPTHQYN